MFLLQNESGPLHFAVELRSRVEAGAGKCNHTQAFQQLCKLKESFLEGVGVVGRGKLLQNKEAGAVPSCAISVSLPLLHLGPLR